MINTYWNFSSILLRALIVRTMVKKMIVSYQPSQETSNESTESNSNLNRGEKGFWKTILEIKNKNPFLDTTSSNKLQLTSINSPRDLPFSIFFVFLYRTVLKVDTSSFYKNCLTSKVNNDVRLRAIKLWLPVQRDDAVPHTFSGTYTSLYFFRIYLLLRRCSIDVIRAVTRPFFDH